MKPTDKTKVKRAPKRGFYDKKTVNAILDKHFICQIAFIYNDYPVIIPTIFGRKDDVIYIHGASVSRMLVTLEKGFPISVNVTQTDGLVLARSAFHHSLNYQSVTVFGEAVLVENENQHSGKHFYKIETKNLNENMIFIHWQAGEKTKVQKIIFVGN